MTARVDWLTPEDARILALEGPVVAGHTCKVIRLAPDGAELSLDELRSQIAGRLDRAPRLRRRLDVAAAPLAQPAWVDDQRFDIARHVLELPLGGPVDERGLAVRRNAHRRAVLAHVVGPDFGTRCPGEQRCVGRDA